MKVPIIGSPVLFIEESRQELIGVVARALAPEP